MVKLFTHTQEIEYCAECANIEDTASYYRCIAGLKFRKVKDIWGEIPSWCPLPEKATDG